MIHSLSINRNNNKIENSVNNFAHISLIYWKKIRTRISFDSSFGSTCNEYNVYVYS